MKIFDPKLTGSIEFQSPVIGAGITSSLYGTSSWATNVVNGGGLSGGNPDYIVRWLTSTTITSSSIYQNPGELNIAIGIDNFDPTNPEQLLVSGSGINVISGKVNIDNYTQLNIKNTNPGTNASADLVATNDTGNESGNYIDVGINGSNFSGLIGGPNDAYIYTTGSIFLIGNQTRGVDAQLKFFAGNDGTVFPLVITGSDALITGSLFGTSSWANSSSLSTSASFSTTSSYVNNLSQSVVITGSLTVTGSVRASQGFTGSLFGTSSYTTGSIYIAGNLATSASFAVTSSNSISASYALTASYSISSSYGLTASYAVSASHGVTSSFVNALSQSLVVTGSLIVTGSVRSSQGFTGSLFGTSSYTTGSIYVAGNLATSASFSVTASNAISASYSTTSSFAFSQLAIKSNTVSAGSFTGNPKKATVTLTTAFPDTNYSIVVTGEDSRAWSVESKLVGSFVINSNSNTALAGNTYWIATSYGQTV
jgi:hypothetical protein